MTPSFKAAIVKNQETLESFVSKESKDDDTDDETKEVSSDDFFSDLDEEINENWSEQCQSYYDDLIKELDG